MTHALDEIRSALEATACGLLRIPAFTAFPHGWRLSNCGLTCYQRCFRPTCRWHRPRSRRNY